MPTVGRPIVPSGTDKMSNEVSIPPPYQRWLQDIRELEAADFISNLVGDYVSVLNIGPSWGRDYYVLSSKGKRVTNLDIAPQEHLPELVLGDVTKELLFPDASFDVVIMAEVLEHLIDDALALKEVRRVLHDSGRLIVTVPFFNDAPEYHVRIHSPASIRRLLNNNGFEITEYYERGGLITFPKLVHGIRKILKPVCGIETYNRLIIRIDRWLSRRASWLLRLSPFYGCYLSAKKSLAADYRTLNAYEFKH
jgi:SAM-dependent methyltransferase